MTPSPAVLDPLIGGRTLTLQRHSPKHGTAVSLFAGVHHSGRTMIDAVEPLDGYRVIFREFFDIPDDALAFWEQQTAELFGTDLDDLL